MKFPVDYVFGDLANRNSSGGDSLTKEVKSEKSATNGRLTFFISWRVNNNMKTSTTLFYGWMCLCLSAVHSDPVRGSSYNGDQGASRHCRLMENMKMEN